MAKVKKTKINLYLVKAGYEDSFQCKEIPPENITEIDGGIKLFAVPGREYEPSWQSGFCEGKINGLSQKSAGAFITIPVEISNSCVRLFIVTFGHVNNYIRQGSLEDQFGIRTAINMGNTNQIRAISGKNISSTPKSSMEQLARLNSVGSFNIDIEQDMMRKITLRNSDDEFGKTITGGVSLVITVPYKLSEMQEALKDIYNIYESDNYKKKGYDWIDNIVPEKDEKIINQLNEALVNKINGENYLEDAGVIASPPEIIDWDEVEGFSASGSRKKAKIQSDITLADFFEQEESEVTIEKLKDRSVYLWISTLDKPIKHWTLFSCLSAEINIDENHYVLSDGKWYAINVDYLSEINKWYNDLEIKSSDLPEYHKQKSKDGKMSHSEENYNKSCALAGYDILDRKLFRTKSGSVEICDLYKNKEFVHVKIYDGSSAPISHLLAQALVSGKLFLEEQEYRKDFNEKISDKLAQSELESPTRKDYSIRLAIITNKDQLNLPFFSRVNLRSALKQLCTLGYCVSIEKVRGNW